MDPTQVKTKLIGYGFSLLEGVDPNPDNYVCAGIIHTKTIQIGCLMRLEPNHSANVSNKFVYDEAERGWGSLLFKSLPLKNHLILGSGGILFDKFFSIENHGR